MEAARYARDLAGGVALAFVVCTSVPVLAAPPLVWQTGEGFRSAKAEVPATGKPGFTLLPPADTGIGFTNRLTDAMVAANRLLENGSGVALGDVDGDGWVDIYFCRLDGGNVLYRNLGGWKFEEVTAASGVACPGQFSTGCALADIDGDGDLDLLVNSLGGGTRAFFNDGRGRFTEVADPKLAKKSGATSMALADVDGDGDLDLYVTHYRTDTVNDNPPGLRMTTGRAPDGSPVVEPRDRFLALPNPGGPTEVLEKGEGDQFYVNKGGGNFIPAPWHVGVFLDEDGQALKEAPPDWGLAAMFRDLDGDGLPDLYVCNDFVYWPDRIWLNQGGKRFKAAPRTAFRHRRPLRRRDAQPAPADARMATAVHLGRHPALAGLRPGVPPGGPAQHAAPRARRRHLRRHRAACRCGGDRLDVERRLPRRGPGRLGGPAHRQRQQP